MAAVVSFISLFHSAHKAISFKVSENKLTIASLQNIIHIKIDNISGPLFDPRNECKGRFEIVHKKKIKWVEAGPNIYRTK